MKLEKEVEILELKMDTCINGENYIKLKFDKLLSDEEFNNIKNNFTGKKIKLILEGEKTILTEREKKYLRGVIRPFRDRVKCIAKHKSYDYKNEEYINIFINDGLPIPLPYFKEGTMYKNMESHKEYTLNELGL